MVALDTNVLLRFMLRDDLDQWQAATTLLSNKPVVVPVGVWLELEWVLRTAYRLSRDVINASLRDVISIDNLSTECAPQLARALDWHEAGLDFADAFHLASAGSARRLATFDRDFRTRANALQSQIEVITP